MAEVGHNSGIAGQALQKYVERVEALEEEKRNLSAHIREVYAQAKGDGFNVKTMREVVKLRRMDKADREEREQLRDLYMHALGMLADTPLGQAATERDLGEPADAAE